MNNSESIIRRVESWLNSRPGSGWATVTKISLTLDINTGAVRRAVRELERQNKAEHKSWHDGCSVIHEWRSAKFTAGNMLVKPCGTGWPGEEMK